MTPERIAEFRAALTQAAQALDAAEALGRDGGKTVMLDQQAVGRLSRMDALQHQAMALADRGRRAAMRRRIEAALARIAAGRFGECLECGEEIAVKRLELDPTLPTCIACAQG